MRISIVIPTYNSEEFIASALDSIFTQTYKDIECVIMDGGSKDKTLAIIEEYKKKFGEKIILSSEKDDGVFDALNKGIHKASGEIIGWMGADDYYADSHVVQKAVEIIKKNNVDMCWGDLVYVHRHESTRILRYWKSSPYKKGLFRKGWQLPHFASFVRRVVFERYGHFLTDLKVSADYELFLRFLEKNNISSSYIPDLFLKMRAGGVSNGNIKNIFRGNLDIYRAWKLNDLHVNPIGLFLPKIYIKLVQFIKKPKSNS